MDKRYTRYIENLRRVRALVRPETHAGMKAADLLEEIKQNYPFAFAMAQRAMAEYEKFYGRPVPESETGYFAIILEMALESLKAQIEKKNILLVCMTGKASSRLLAFRFRNEFGVYIDRLDVCSMYEFERYDLSRVDYVFTTVPLQTAAAVPI